MSLSANSSTTAFWSDHPPLLRQETALSTPHPPGKLYKNLYVQVLAAIVIGVALGYFNPTPARKMKPLGDGFILKTLLYFEVVASIGLIVVNVFQPGARN